MNDVVCFIEDELKQAETRQKNNIERIHSIKLDIEFINKAISQLVNSKDSTQLLFLPSDHISGFEGQELERLNKEKEKLIQEENVIDKEIVSYDKRILQLKEYLNNKNKYFKIKQNQLDVLNVQEKERQRIARDIHDTVVQNMSAMIYKNEFISKILDTDHHRAKIELDSCNHVLKDCINELRNTIFNLRPMCMEDLDFVSAFSSVIEHIQNSTDMIVSYQLNHDKFNTELDPVVAIALIRIIQELCNNSIKYSKGTKISVVITLNNNSIQLEQSDNGIGFEVDQINHPKKDNTGFGLCIIRERVHLLGGTLKAQSNEKSKEISYHVLIPLSEERKSNGN